MYLWVCSAAAQYKFIYSFHMVLFYVLAGSFLVLLIAHMAPGPRSVSWMGQNTLILMCLNGMDGARVFCFLIGLILMTHSALGGETIALRVDDATLQGTLEVPAGTASCPAAVIISGSGPTDRDGNNPLAGGRNDSLKLLAQALAARGIASVRYDKRGIGQSAAAMNREEDLQFETYIDDAVQWARNLRANRRFTRVAIIGHSEGALIGMAAARKMSADAVVSIAGAGFPAPQVLRRQLRQGLPENLWKEAEAILERVENGQTVTAVSPALQALFRPSVQPYLISWSRYDPAELAAELTVPLLIVQGSTDIQTGLADAEHLAKANRCAELVIIDGMNHVLKPVSGNLRDQMASYGDPDLPISKKLVEVVASFLTSPTTPACKDSIRPQTP